MSHSNSNSATTSVEKLRDTLRKLQAVAERPGTEGERLAAEAALERLDPIRKLRRHLHNLTEDFVRDAQAAQVLGLLAMCWDQLDCPDASAISSDLLLKANGLQWKPPILHFQIRLVPNPNESVRLSRFQLWQIDLEQKMATFMPCSTWRVTGGA